MRVVLDLGSIVGAVVAVRCVECGGLGDEPNRRRQHGRRVLSPDTGLPVCPVCLGSGVVSELLELEALGELLAEAAGRAAARHGAAKGEISGGG